MENREKLKQGYFLYRKPYKIKKSSWSSDINRSVRILMKMTNSCCTKSSHSIKSFSKGDIQIFQPMEWNWRWTIFHLAFDAKNCYLVQNKYDTYETQL